MSRFLSVCLFSVFAVTATAAESQRIYLGTYTGEGEADAKGIYLTELNTEDGSLMPPRLSAECACPAFLAKHPHQPLLYAVAEVWDGKDESSVYAFAIDEKTGALTKLNKGVVPGKGPCHLCVCSGGKDSPAAVAVACYGDGSVHGLPVLENGKLGKCVSSIRLQGNGPNERRQKGPHAHAVYYHATQGEKAGFLNAVDLGTDKVHTYVIDTETGKIKEIEKAKTASTLNLPEGSGPRHLAFGVHEPFFYVLNELASTICVFRPSREGGVLLQTVSTLPEGVKPEDHDNSTAEIFMHPGGKFLYASNRGHDSIAFFRIDPKNGKLRFVETVSSGGKHPRSFDLSSDGRWLIAANADTNNVVTFEIDPKSGSLRPTGKEITVPKPVCVLPVR